MGATGATVDSPVDCYKTVRSRARAAALGPDVTAGRGNPHQSENPPARAMATTFHTAATAKAA